MSDTQRCRLVNSGDTGYGANMSGDLVCEGAAPDHRVQRPVAAASAPDDAYSPACNSAEEYYGLTGIGGMFISMIWRYMTCDGR